MKKDESLNLQLLLNLQLHNGKMKNKNETKLINPKIDSNNSIIKYSWFFIVIIFCLIQSILSQEIINEHRWDSDQIYPDIVAIKDGGFIATYSEINNAAAKGPIWSTYAYKYDEFAKKTNSSKIQINDYDENFDSNFCKSILLSNGFVFSSWLNSYQNKTKYSIFGKTINPLSMSMSLQIKLIEDFRIQKYPSIMMQYNYFNLIPLNEKFILVFDNKFKVLSNEGNNLSPDTTINLNDAEPGFEGCGFPDNKAIFLYNNKNSKLISRLMFENYSLSNSELIIDDIQNENNPYILFKCITLTENRYVVVYPKNDMKIRVFNLNNKQVADAEILYTSNSAIYPQISYPGILALNDGGFLLTYFRASEKQKFYYQRFNQYANKINDPVNLKLNLNYELADNREKYRVQQKLVQLKSGAILMSFHAYANVNDVNNLDPLFIIIENCFINGYFKDTNKICLNNQKTCGEGYFSDNSNTCLSCNNMLCPINEVCSSCKNRYDYNTCRECVSSSSNLFFDSSRAITYCSDKSIIGHYKHNYIYQKCVDNCKTCSNFYECQECQSGFDLNDGICVKADCVAICPKNQLNCVKCSNCSNSNTCIRCQSGELFEDFETKIIYCDNKSPLGFYNDKGVFKECFENCIRCRNAETCEICITGFYSTGQACLRCPDNCTSCESEKKCLRCIENYSVSNVTGICEKQSIPCCEKFGNGECTQIAPHFYFIKSSNICDKCIEDCEICKDKSNCQKCRIPLKFVDDKCKCENFSYCLSNDGKVCNECVEGYFKYSPCECKPCVVGCKSCSNGNSCNMCFPNYQPLITKNARNEDIILSCEQIKNCLKQNPIELNKCDICDKGFYLDKDSRCIKCSLFDKYCETCSAYSECTSCVTQDEISKENLNLKLYNGLCKRETEIKCVVDFCIECLENNKNQCSKCKDGYIKNGNSLCEFAGNCAVKDTKTSECSSCLSGYALENGNCICRGTEDKSSNSCCKMMEGCKDSRLKFINSINKCGCESCKDGFIRTKYDFQCINFNIKYTNCYTRINDNLNLTDLGEDCVMNLTSVFTLIYHLNCYIDENNYPNLPNHKNYFFFSLNTLSYYNYLGYMNINEIKKFLCDQTKQSYFIFELNCNVTISDNVIQKLKNFKRLTSDDSIKFTNSTNYENSKLISDIIETHINLCTADKGIAFRSSPQVRTVCINSNATFVDFVNEVCLGGNNCQVKKGYNIDIENFNKCYDCGKNYFFDYDYEKCFMGFISKKESRNSLINFGYFVICIMLLILLGLTILYFFPPVNYFKKKNENKIDEENQSFKNNDNIQQGQKIEKNDIKIDEIKIEENKIDNANNGNKDSTNKFNEKIIQKENILEWIISFSSILYLLLEVFFILTFIYQHVYIKWSILSMLFIEPIWFFFSGIYYFLSVLSKISQEKNCLWIFLKFITIYTFFCWFDILGNNTDPCSLNGILEYIDVFPKDENKKLEFKLGLRKTKFIKLLGLIIKAIFIYIENELLVFPILITIISFFCLLPSILSYFNLKKKIRKYLDNNIGKDNDTNNGDNNDKSSNNQEKKDLNNIKNNSNNKSNNIELRFEKNNNFENTINNINSNLDYKSEGNKTDFTKIRNVGPEFVSKLDINE